MRKQLSLILAVLLLIPLLVLTGCSTDTAKVESVLEIDSNFKGHREITVTFPLEINVDDLVAILEDKNPFIDSKKSKFEYLGVAENGYVFVMDISFSSHNDYLDQVEKLVGREVTSYMGQPDTIFTKGTRMVEDFDVADLIKWLVDITHQNESTESIEFDYSVNTVSVNGSVFNTGSTVDISKREGKPINSITIETTNLKDGTYDRTITFSIPNKTYTELIGSIKEYFKSNTSPVAQYCDFSSRGTSWEYKVIYKGITLEELSEYTAMLLDVDESPVFYGDKNNSSTPLSEGLVFEETVNTLSFMDYDGESIEIDYKYALPTKTTHGDGSVYSHGTWKNQGSWKEGIYTVSVDSDTMNVRIPDGIEYAINGIRFDLNVVSQDEFVRTTEFLYSKTQGMDGMTYAQNFFKSKGAVVEVGEDDENLICRVICKGSSAEITDELVKYFGSGNFMAYEIKDSSMALSAKTKFTDYVNLSRMLNSTNANRPMIYTVHSSCAESINELMYNGVESAYTTETSSRLTVDVVGGNGTIVYNGSIPNATNVAIFVIIGLSMILTTIAVIVFMVSKQRKKEKSLLTEDGESYSPQQTTTFSIAELNRLSDKTSKKLREEIDRDINEKIEADRIESLSKELKAKEIEQLSKMIYGDPEADSKTDEESDEQKSEDESADDQQ